MGLIGPGGAPWQGFGSALTAPEETRSTAPLVGCGCCALIFDDVAGFDRPLRPVSLIPDAPKKELAEPSTEDRPPSTSDASALQTGRVTIVDP
jgi:hypothetical protein